MEVFLVLLFPVMFSMEMKKQPWFFFFYMKTVMAQSQIQPHNLSLAFLSLDPAPPHPPSKVLSEMKQEFLNNLVNSN